MSNKMTNNKNQIWTIYEEEEGTRSILYMLYDTFMDDLEEHNGGKFTKDTKAHMSAILDKFLSTEAKKKFKGVKIEYDRCVEEGIAPIRDVLFGDEMTKDEEICCHILYGDYVVFMNK